MQDSPGGAGLCVCWSRGLSPWASVLQAGSQQLTFHSGMNAATLKRFRARCPLKEKKKQLNFLELKLLLFSINGKLAKKFMPVILCSSL